MNGVEVVKKSGKIWKFEVFLGQMRFWGFGMENDDGILLNMCYRKCVYGFWGLIGVGMDFEVLRWRLWVISMTGGDLTKEVHFWLGFWGSDELEKVREWKNRVGLFWEFGQEVKYVGFVRKNGWFGFMVHSHDSWEFG